MSLANATGPSCVGFLFSLDFLMQHQSSGSLGSCPPIWWVTDGWSAVTTGICGLRESPFPVAELGLFHLVDCMQHEMAAHMLEVCRLLYTSCLALSLGQSKLLKGFGKSRVEKDSFLWRELYTVVAWIQEGTKLALSPSSKECCWAQSV